MQQLVLFPTAHRRHRNLLELGACRKGHDIFSMEDVVLRPTTGAMGCRRCEKGDRPRRATKMVVVRPEVIPGQLTLQSLLGREVTRQRANRRYRSDPVLRRNVREASRHMQARYRAERAAGIRPPRKRNKGRKLPKRKQRSFQLHIRHWRGMCAYCGVRPFEHIDHVIPRHRGGSDRNSNLVPACEPCNQSKGRMLVIEWKRHLRQLQTALVGL
jgi:5-methylcytosine-specific restriction endonuclease McrA